MNSNLESDESDASDLPPLLSALKASAERNKLSCFHFPGHNRGKAAPPALTQLIGKQPFLHDATEHPDLDRFYSPKGPLLEAKRLAARLFGAKETWFLVGGTSCGVQAAVMATCSPGDTIILPRNAHVSATAGVVLAGALPKYIVPHHNLQWDVLGGVTPSQVNLAFEESKVEGRKVSAVFITSPTYNGICSIVSEISDICHSHGVPLIVDEAHGAHFKFHPQMPQTALEQGADIAIQSTHKVLSSLSQSSMLHISGEMIDTERLHKCLHLLQTTSPNWLLLASLDACRHQLSTNPGTIFDEAMKLADEARILISEIPRVSVLHLSAFPSGHFPAMDPLRITVGVWRLGISGYHANGMLINDLGIVPELCGTKSVVLAFSLGTTGEDVQKLVAAFKHLSATFRLNLENDNNLDIRKLSVYHNHVMSMNPREAFFASKTEMKFEECCGEVCGDFIAPNPPGIPIIVPGEVITEEVLFYLQQIKEEGGYVHGAANPLLDFIVVCKKSD